MIKKVVLSAGLLLGVLGGVVVAQEVADTAPRAEASHGSFFWSWEDNWYGLPVWCLHSGSPGHPILYCFP